MTSPPATADPELFGLIDAEHERRSRTLQLIAADTPATPAVLAALASDLDAKYAEGYPGARYHGGCEVIDEIESLARRRAVELFDAGHANVQPVSGTAASAAVYAAFAQPGDPVLALRLAHGGHQTHGSRASFSGRWFSPIDYPVSKSDERIDYDRVREIAMVHRPRILVAGSTSYARHIDFAALRSIADDAECILWVDAAHLAGLVAGGVAPSPVPYADVVTVTTNKILRGPRGGLILCREEHASAVDKAVFPFTQGSPAPSALAAKAVCFRESATEEYAGYARTVVDNAKALSAALAERDLRTVSGGTDTHLAVIDVSSAGVSGVEARRRLAAAGIVADKAVLPFDPRPVGEGSAVRVGTPSVTVAGLVPADMRCVAGWIDDAISADTEDTSSRHDAIRAEIAERIGR